MKKFIIRIIYFDQSYIIPRYFDDKESAKKQIEYYKTFPEKCEYIYNNFDNLNEYEEYEKLSKEILFENYEDIKYSLPMLNTCSYDIIEIKQFNKNEVIL